MNKLLSFIIFVTGFAVATSQSDAIDATPQWNDFRGTYGTFSPFPTSLSHELIDSERWMRVSSDCSNDGLFNGFQYVKDGDRLIRLIFDINGIIAGIQYLIPKNEVLTPTNPINYNLIPIHQNATYDDIDYFISTVYFVPPSTICTTGRSSQALMTEGTGTGIWIQNGSNPSQIFQVPSIRPEDGGPGSNNCFPGMGFHTVESADRIGESNCAEFIPTVGLYSQYNNLLGLAFISVGNLSDSRFEKVPNPEPVIRSVLGEATPQCLVDLAVQNGVSSHHMYFTENPWNITCPS